MSPTKRPSAVTGLQRGVSANPAPAAAPETAPAPALPPRPGKPVRFTLDLDPQLHADLKTWAAQHGTNAAQVVRALAEELLSDPVLADRVRDRAWQAARR